MMGTLTVEKGRVRPEAPAIMPTRKTSAELIQLPVAYADLGDGRVMAHDGAGIFLGHFTNERIAKQTVDFLSR